MDPDIRAELCGPRDSKASRAGIDDRLWPGAGVVCIEPVCEVVLPFLHRDGVPAGEHRRVHPCLDRHARREVERVGRGHGHEVVDAVEHQGTAVAASRSSRLRR